MTVTMITYQGQPAAFAHASGFELAPAIEALPDGHPTKRVVAYMCAYDRLVRAGELDGPYDQATAELYARLALIDDDEFIARVLAGETDAQLADSFRVPVEQIAAKHSDIGHNEQLLADLRARLADESRASGDHRDQSSDTPPERRMRRQRRRRT